MKMTRKILALLLSVVMVLSLAACGKQNDGTNTGDSTTPAMMPTPAIPRRR